MKILRAFCFGIPLGVVFLVGLMAALVADVGAWAEFKCRSCAQEIWKEWHRGKL